uniref:Leucine-rich repeat-containing N-terminal plant-type domain-containing protein n=1 Tax=Cucumis sativus TaxID=3659 RepID=A0A0A0KPL7_CUCSA
MRKLVCKESSVVVSLWMMILLLLLLHFCFSITAAAPCIQKERQALLRFKNSFYDDPSLRLASWNASTDCCNWKGVGCNQITGHVTIIDLRRDPWQIGNAVCTMMIRCIYGELRR